MARDINYVKLEGTVGRDSETRFTANGKAITSFSLATSRNKRNDAGEWERVDTQWHNVKYWGEFQASKGERLAVEGSNNYRQWQDKDGNKRYVTEIVCFDEPQRVDKFAKAAPASSPTKQRRELVAAAHKAVTEKRAPVTREEGWEPDDDDVPLPF